MINQTLAQMLEHMFLPSIQALSDSDEPDSTCAGALCAITELSDEHDADSETGVKHAAKTRRKGAPTLGRSPYGIASDVKSLKTLCERGCKCESQRLQRTASSKGSCFESFLQDESLLHQLAQHRSAWKGMHKLDQDRQAHYLMQRPCMSESVSHALNIHRQWTQQQTQERAHNSRHKSEQVVCVRLPDRIHHYQSNSGLPESRVKWWICTFWGHGPRAYSYPPLHHALGECLRAIREAVVHTDGL